VKRAKRAKSKEPGGVNSVAGGKGEKSKELSGMNNVKSEKSWKSEKGAKIKL
jgi:hypothetical protein